MFRVFVFLNLWMCIGVAGIKEDAGEGKGSIQDFVDIDNDDYEYLQESADASASTETAVTLINRRLKMTKPVMPNRTVTDLEDVVYKILARTDLRRKSDYNEYLEKTWDMDMARDWRPRFLYIWDFQFDPGTPSRPDDCDRIEIVYYEHIGSVVGGIQPDVFRFRKRPDERYDMHWTYSEIPREFEITGMTLNHIFMNSVEGYEVREHDPNHIPIYRMRKIRNLKVYSTTPEPTPPITTPKEWTESCPSKPPGLETIIKIIKLKPEDRNKNKTYEYYKKSEYVYGVRELRKPRLHLVLANRTDVEKYMLSLMIFYDNRTKTFRERYRPVDWLEEKMAEHNGPLIDFEYDEAVLNLTFVYDFSVKNKTYAKLEKKQRETLEILDDGLTKIQLFLKHIELYFDDTSGYWEWRTKQGVTVLTTEFPYEKLNMEALLAIISELTYDYETNMELVVNRSFGGTLPTCAPLKTSPEPLANMSGKETGIIIAKCYVCGLKQTGIPRDAYCAESFGMTIGLYEDLKARGRQASYRKNCRYLDTEHFELNETDPKSEYGRWTGGCAVRWVDISGIYTQRVCRSRNRPVKGNHIVSPRLARLEKALSLKDTGCIVSPAASLTPLSRGVSLYARYHACVCRGDWCNQAIFITPSHSTILMLSLIYSLFS